jgi:hypothetical protein
MLIPGTFRARSLSGFQRTSRHALAMELSKALDQREPMIVVTSAAAAGDTTFRQTLDSCCDSRTIVATVNTPPRDIQDFLRQVLESFGLLTTSVSEVPSAKTYDGLVSVLERFLSSLRFLDAKALVVINGAEHIDRDLLDDIRTLSRLKADAGHQPLQIILLGSSELSAVVDQYNARELRTATWRLHLHLLNALERRLHVNPLKGLSIAAGLLIAASLLGWMMRDAVAVTPPNRDASTGVPGSNPVSPPPATRQAPESTASSGYLPMVPVDSPEAHTPRTTPRPPTPAARSAPVRPAVTAPVAPRNLQSPSVSELLQLSDALSRKPDVRALEQIRNEVIRRQSTGDGATDGGELSAALAHIETALSTARQLQLAEDGRRLAAGSR